MRACASASARRRARWRSRPSPRTRWPANTSRCTTGRAHGRSRPSRPDGTLVPETIPCPLCGRSAGIAEPTKGRLLDLSPPYAICRCGACNLLYLNPRPTVDELEALYLGDPYYGADNATRGATRGRYYHGRLERLERFRP